MSEPTPMKRCGGLLRCRRRGVPLLVGVSLCVGRADDGGMSIEDNKVVVRRFIDALFTEGDLGATDEYLSDDFVNHDPPIGLPPDAEGMRTAGAMFRAAFPDWHSDL